jgi:hypothetical protein
MYVLLPLHLIYLSIFLLHTSMQNQDKYAKRKDVVSQGDHYICPCPLKKKLSVLASLASYGKQYISHAQDAITQHEKAKKHKTWLGLDHTTNHHLLQQLKTHGSTLRLPQEADEEGDVMYDTLKSYCNDRHLPINKASAWKFIATKLCPGEGTVTVTPNEREALYKVWERTCCWTDPLPLHQQNRGVLSR